jgi:hypothetical protein
MLKDFFAATSAAAMILGMIVPFVSSPHYARGRIVMCGIVALMAFVAQLWRQRVESRKERKASELDHLRLEAKMDEQGQEQLRLMLELLERVPKPKAKAFDSATVTNALPTLSSRLKATATRLYEFLVEKGPRPSVPDIADESLSLEERFKRVMTAVRPWVDGIAFGYDHKFKGDLQGLLSEMREHGIDSKIEDWEIEPPHGQTAEGIRTIVDRLIMTSAKLDGDSIRKDSSYGLI